MTATGDSLPRGRASGGVLDRRSLPGLLMTTGLALLAGGLRLWIGNLHPRGMVPQRHRPAP